MTRKKGPLGRLSCYRINRLRTVIAAYRDWMADYAHGTAVRERPPMPEQILTGPISKLEDRAAQIMWERAVEWLCEADSLQLRKANRLTAQRARFPEAYREATNSEKSVRRRLEEQRVTRGLQALYPLDWHQRGEESREVVREVLRAADNV